ncbi:MAG: hypothetical protein KC912_05155 [Proteobacteria bacterium]|nr:hypothetical protein [Pseudomonadota bacterium]
MSRFKPSLLLALVLMASTPALAAGMDDAEAIRLRAEMQGLAERAAWGGVERAYVALRDGGTDLTYEDHFLGAQSAKVAGDLGAVRSRLLAANAVSENQDVMDWLFAINSHFGEVALSSKPGSAELSIDKLPFAADQKAVLEFAQAHVAESGSYTGYLPKGVYTFGDQPFQVLPAAPTVTIDLGAAPAVSKPLPEEPASEGQASGSDETAVAPAVSSSGPGMLSLLVGGGTSFGWVGAGGVAHFGPVGARVAVGFDPVFSIPSVQAGLRAYPVGFADAGAAKVGPFAELALAPLRWKEVGKALYGPAVSVGAEVLVGDFAIDFQVGGGITRDQVRTSTRPGLIVGLGVGYNFS